MNDLMFSETLGDSEREREIQERASSSLQPDCCACCREDIKAILKWIDAVTDELHDAGEMRKQTKRILWNLRAELDNSIKSRSTHNDPGEPSGVANLKSKI